MGSFAPFRTLLSAVMAVLLLIGAGTCVACWNTQGVTLAASPCCMPDGSCRTASSMPGCFQGRTSSPAVVEPTAQVRLVLADSILLAAAADSRVLVTSHVAPVLERARYVTPDVHLLNSVFLI